MTAVGQSMAMGGVRPLPPGTRRRPARDSVEREETPCVTPDGLPNSGDEGLLRHWLGHTAFG
jgi:hypothetical protein